MRITRRGMFSVLAGGAVAATAAPVAARAVLKVSRPDLLRYYGGLNSKLCGSYCMTTEHRKVLSAIEKFSDGAADRWATTRAVTSMAVDPVVECGGILRELEMIGFIEHSKFTHHSGSMDLWREPSIRRIVRLHHRATIRP